MKKSFIIFIIIIIFSFIYFSCDKRNRNILVEDDCKGVIIKIYREPRNHNVYQFEIIQDEKKRTFIADFYPKSWIYATIGDSIKKKKGESFITIKKIDGSSMTFETRVK